MPSQLKEKIKSTEKSNAEIEAILCEIQSCQFGKQAIQDCQAQFEILDQKINEIKAEIKSMSINLSKTKLYLGLRQTKLLNDLKSFFPIERIDHQEYSICGLRLPMDLNLAKDEEVVSAALGYIVQLLILASKYLEISLRYTPLFMGSRSLVRDAIIGTVPLFRKNVEKDRFDRAVLWLKYDIDQILMSRGLSYDVTKPLLFNVQQIFACDRCQSLAF